MTKNRLLFSMGTVLSLLFSACNSQPKPDGLPPLYPLTLTITQDGVPLDGASVSLFSEDGRSPWTIGGTTDASGNMSPMTHGKYPGIPAGKYKVCVFKVEVVAKVQPDETEISRPQRPDVYDLVDVKLKSPVTTVLTLEAGPGKKKTTLEAGKPIRSLIHTNGA